MLQAHVTCSGLGLSQSGLPAASGCDVSPPIVLIANDQEWSARSIESVLAPQGYAIVRAFTGQQAIDTAKASIPALIILDAQLPDIHGFEVCRAIRADPNLGPAVPVIITTAGPAGRPQRLEAARAGAWDFQGQPLDAELLVARAEAFLLATEEIRNARQAAAIDPQTGLFSLAGLTQRLRQLSAQATRLRIPLACVVLTPETPDNAVADDATLAEIGTALRRASRESDVVGRISADEFLVVAPATDQEDAQHLAERLIEALGPELILKGIRLKTSVLALDEGANSVVIDEEELLRRVKVT